ncbi:hypothetical protein IAG44_39725 [Streptomyces roseirectus]|uniref:Uncharacterized protein n=1 Tax=Streptomyces roseirectus TaxID=2768066 RepID=A0A7H0IQ81_9ACTN|nr:hypothetical protein [Streptomyces roseirectus]QNP74947.1 hypothetical protein IAG44_39725 [Streptomyces roseirectus]
MPGSRTRLHPRPHRNPSATTAMNANRSSNHASCSAYSLQLGLTTQRAGTTTPSTHPDFTACRTNPHPGRAAQVLQGYSSVYHSPARQPCTTAKDRTPANDPCGA